MAMTCNYSTDEAKIGGAFYASESVTLKRSNLTAARRTLGLRLSPSSRLFSVRMVDAKGLGSTLSWGYLKSDRCIPSIPGVDSRPGQTPPREFSDKLGSRQ